MNPFQVFWQSACDTFEDLLPLTLISTVWLLVVLPLPLLAGGLAVGGAPFGAAALLMLTTLPMGTASVGLTVIAQRIHEGRTVSWGDFVAGARRHSRSGWGVYGAWLAGLLVLLVNVSFYAQIEAPIGVYLTLLFAYFLVAWISLLIYLGPLMLLQERPSVRLAFRNAFVLAFSRPLFTLVTQVLMSIIVCLSMWPPLFLLILITPALLAVWGFRATVTLIIADAEARHQARQERERASATTPSNPPATEKGRSGQIRPRE
ncbi:MAG: hypothetical protein NZ699_14205 [Roseiflexus sp.]|nr:hypothetical protein [Roseiflexus sp.]MCS7290279.1 hypothetical protein [Roseiflexus sp.]MDW8146033.1 hypothetical protein [Roseiflexaceae bacterium]MDW8231305.1 hypothetical protein [Roseiflexaceae bacterium]